MFHCLGAASTIRQVYVNFRYVKSIFGNFILSFSDELSGVVVFWVDVLRQDKGRADEDKQINSAKNHQDCDYWQNVIFSPFC